MTKPIGGRGHLAPYATTHLRVPLPIKTELEMIIAQYRECVLTGKEFSKEQLPTIEQAKLQARKVLRARKSARKSIIMLLTALYGVNMDETDLDD